MHTEQKVWSNWSLRQQNYLNYPTSTEYYVITWLFWAHVLLWGPLFRGAPVQLNMLNMPKSASAPSASVRQPHPRLCVSDSQLHAHDAFSPSVVSTFNIHNSLILSASTKTHLFH